MRESAERLTVTLADVESARLRIAGYVHRTPVLSSSQLDRLVDARSSRRWARSRRGAPSRG